MLYYNIYNTYTNIHNCEIVIPLSVNFYLKKYKLTSAIGFKFLYTEMTRS